MEMNSIDIHDKQILMNSFKKIKSMVERLTLEEQAANPSNGGVRDHIAEVILQQSVQERRLAIKGIFDITINLEFDRSKLNLISVDQLQFSRMISNLIQNSVDAISSSGTITVSCRSLGAELFILIKDTGKGIDSKIVEKLFARGATFNKPGGSGRGLFHAKSCIERWDGEISLQSEPGVGTNILLKLPVALNTPSLIGQIDLDNEVVNVVVDDEFEVYANLKPQIGKKALYFDSPLEFEKWNQQNKGHEKTRYIFDYNLMSSKNGIDLISELDNPSEAILATNDYDRPEVLAASQATGFRIFPKVFLDAF